MLDVFVLADDWRANPITSWTVRTHETRDIIAKVTMCPEGYRLTPQVGSPSIHEGLLEARDCAAAMFTPGPLQIN